MGHRFGLADAVLGMLAALAADAPEITTAVSAMAGHQTRVGAGVAIGANLFNLAWLLGLAAVWLGPLRLSRRTIGVEGAVTVWTTLCTLLAVVAALPVWLCAVLVLVVLLPYLRVHGGDAEPLLDESEPQPAVLAPLVAGPSPGRPPPTSPAPIVALVISTAIVVGASIAMERAGVELGNRHGVAPGIVGGLVLAAVTSVPNVVAGLYLARRGRHAAALSTSLHSNMINLAAGMLVPGAIVGLGSATGSDILIAAANLALTVFVLAGAWLGRGLSRRLGQAIIGAYAVFAVALVAVA